MHIEPLESRDCPTSAPVIGNAAFDLLNPRTNDMLTAQVLYADDADYDSISFTYEWSFNGNVVQTTNTSDLTDTLDLSQPGLGDKNDTISVSITPFDANDTCDAWSMYTDVANSSPTIDCVIIDQSSPGTNDVITATVVSSNDDDGDTVTHIFDWYVNSVYQYSYGTSAMSDTFDLSQSGYGDKGDVIFVQVTTFDGADYGTYETASTTVANSAAVIDPSNLPSVQSFIGDAVSLQIAATDYDGDTITYSATGLPTGLSIDSETGLITGTISTSASTTTPYSVTITANDGTVNGTQSFDWTISSAYVVVVQGDQHSIAGETVDLPLYAWKLDGHTLSYSATGLPDGLSIDSETGDITGTISYGEENEEPYEVTITATDSAGDTTGEVTIDWYVNAPGVLAFDIGDLESIVDASIDVTIEAWSTEGGTVTYSASGLPSGLSIDTDTGEITGTVASNADLSSPYAVTVTATNTDASVSTNVSFSWAVRQLVLRAPEDQANLVDATVSLVLVAPYAGSGTLVFSASGLPDGLSINTATGEISGTIDSDADSSTPYSVTVTVTDGTLTQNKTFNWDVKKLFVNAPGDQFNLDEDEPTLTFTVTQIYGDTITYAATGLPTGLSVNASTGAIEGTIDEDAHENGPFTVTVTATDTTLSVTASKTFTWVVDADPVSLFTAWGNAEFTALQQTQPRDLNIIILRNLALISDATTEINATTARIQTDVNGIATDLAAYINTTDAETRAILLLNIDVRTSNIKFQLRQLSLLQDLRTEAQIRRIMYLWLETYGPLQRP